MFFKFVKATLYFISIFFLTINFSFSEKIDSISVSGNERISDETVIMFSKLNIGKDANTSDLNNSLKILFETNYFKNVSLDINQGIVNIIVEENIVYVSDNIGFMYAYDYVRKKIIWAKNFKVPF